MRAALLAVKRALKASPALSYPPAPSRCLLAQCPRTERSVLELRWDCHRSPHESTDGPASGDAGPPADGVSVVSRDLSTVTTDANCSTTDAGLNGGLRSEGATPPDHVLRQSRAPIREMIIQQTLPVMQERLRKNAEGMRSSRNAARFRNRPLRAMPASARRRTIIAVARDQPTTV